MTDQISFYVLQFVYTHSSYNLTILPGIMYITHCLLFVSKINNNMTCTFYDFA